MMAWLSPVASSNFLLASRRIGGSRALGLPTTACRNKHAPNLTRRFLTGRNPRDPLRVLFCGSDSFSQMSLDALIKEHKNNPELIQSIDVAVRPLKPIGRGMKQLAPKGPMHILAEQHQLPLHEIDTFTGWSLPKYDLPINLIIAVSFGLFVPPRILRSAQFGGLNVHPSLLPDLRGPAPIHHALLAHDTHTGVSLQTLSDKTFDAGAVLLQTPLPGIPIDPSWDVEALTQRLAVVGSEMLIQGLREGLHIPPHVDVSRRPLEPFFTVPGNFGPRHAPKLEKFDFHVQWDEWTASDAAIRSTRLHKKLWTVVIDKKGKPQRWTLEGVEEVDYDSSKWAAEFDACIPDDDDERSSSGGDASTTPTLNTLAFQQTLQRPPKQHKKKHSIFNDPTAAAEQDQVMATNPPPNRAENSVAPASPTTSRIVLPYVCPKDDDSQAIIIRLLEGGGFIRIPKITVEGRPTHPAALVANQFTKALTFDEYMANNLAEGGEEYAAEKRDLLADLGKSGN